MKIADPNQLEDDEKLELALLQKCSNSLSVLDELDWTLKLARSKGIYDETRRASEMGPAIPQQHWFCFIYKSIIANYAVPFTASESEFVTKNRLMKRWKKEATEPFEAALDPPYASLHALLMEARNKISVHKDLKGAYYQVLVSNGDLPSTVPVQSFVLTERFYDHIEHLRAKAYEVFKQLETTTREHLLEVLDGPAKFACLERSVTCCQRPGGDPSTCGRTYTIWPGCQIERLMDQIEQEDS